MQIKIGIIGLGYVGLPLAVEFGKIYSTIGFDVLPERIKELHNGYDRTLEVEKEELKQATLLEFSSNPEKLTTCNHYIVTVPTPIDSHKQPDLNPLILASKTVGKQLSYGDVVIYESTVYPGCTEERCVPILEQYSGLKFNQDFFVGYSPERINPGDKLHNLNNIVKVTSGSTASVAKQVDELYQRIVSAGTYMASSIKVAEAAKVIENAQRDLNIAFVNELAILFNKMNIDTLEVLQAAGTKWNFLPFKPGLVGGHCIGVDPYYLTHKAQEIGHHPEIILAGRRINDHMGKYVANQLIKLMIRQQKQVNCAKVLVLGITFKENCPDIRNSKVIDIIRELEEFHCQVDVYDPWADKDEVAKEYQLQLQNDIELSNYDAIVLAVAHSQFGQYDFQAIRSKSVIYDIKGFLPKELSHQRL